MTLLDLSAEELLLTTRAVRKRLDFEKPLDPSLIHECLEVALQAPSGSNAQGWHFVVVTDSKKRKAIGDLYAKGFALYREMNESAHALRDKASDELDTQQMERVVDSAEYLASNLHRAPALVIPCVEGRTDEVTGRASTMANASQFGSVLPAFWSFMLAARLRGLGTAWTTIHLMFEKQVAELLDIPFDRITQAGLSPVAYTKGTDFKLARRKPLASVLHENGW
ncbi:MAG: nitroreductase [Deltaproteobacteria bacterium]|nr:nitroreductase [Deltaproteobacteria bacterium]